jgi:hypothetical protein
MSEEIELREFRPSDEAEIVATLNACQRGAWGAAAHWRWKHRDRPGFVPEDVLVARAGGAVVGCFHGAVLPLKLEEGLVVPMSFDGDYAVLPEHRGRDIPAAAHDRSDERLARRGVVFRGGFTSRELNERFYHKRFGYVFVPGVTAQFRKYLGPGPLAPRVAALGERLLARPALRRALARPFVVDLAIEGFPPCHLEMAGTGFRLERGAAPRPDLCVWLPYALLTVFAGGERPGAAALARLILGGRLRASGLVRSAPRLAALALALRARAV